jgi:hypothetical protein
MIPSWYRLVNNTETPFTDFTLSGPNDLSIAFGAVTTLQYLQQEVLVILFQWARSDSGNIAGATQSTYNTETFSVLLMI